MVTILIGNWWALAGRGAAAVLFGIIAILSPAMTATALVLLFAAYVLVDGILALVAAVRAAERHGRSWPLLFEAVFDVALALIVFLFPGTALIVLVYAIAFWALLTGVALLAAGFSLLRRHGELLLIVCGALSVLLGIALLLNPLAAIVALAWWLGIYALLFGAVLLTTAFRLRWQRPF